MHEFELGVWKALLTHLVQILHSLGALTVQEFNFRYVLFSLPICYDATCSPELSFWQISSFGASTICRFTHNVVDLKKLAARDFEDILQVSLVHIVYNALQPYSCCVSAAFLALKGYFLRHIMTPYYGSYTSHHIGMPLRSYVFTLRD
jgi:hypothetical protein